VGYLNSEQEAHLQYLKSIPPAERCWCGWYRLGECMNKCPPGKTLAHKMEVWCKECQNYPSPDGKYPITHRIGCSQDKR